MVDSVSEKQLAHYKEIFMLFDTKKDKKISLEQVGDVLRALGLNPTQKDIKKTQKELDPEGSKRVTFDEFLPFFTTLTEKKEHESAEEFLDGLKVLDKEGNGKIDATELRQVLSSLGDTMMSEEIDSMLEGLEDGQGQINYEDFIKVISQ